MEKGEETGGDSPLLGVRVSGGRPFGPFRRTVEVGDFRREITFEPGYDHRDDPDAKQRQHGCHGMNLRFVLHGEHGSVQFLLYTGWLPGQSSFAAGPALSPMGADVGYHWDEPRYEGQDWHSCAMRPAGRCYYDGSGLQADELFQKFTREGDAVVWRTLEERYADLDARSLPAEPEAGLA